MDFDPHRHTAADDPYPLYAELRRNHPLCYSEARDLWVLSRYEDVRATLLDAEIFASGFGTVPSGFRSVKPMLISEDPPYHTHLRAAVHSAFTPRRMRQLEQFVRRICGELLDVIDPTQETDIVRAYTDPLPVAVITELLGVPIGDRDEFKQRADAIIHTTQGRGREALDAQSWITDYLERVLPLRERNPGDDLVSQLLHPESGEERLTHDEVIGFCTILLLAGTETTTNALAGSLVLLDRQRELRARLAAHPEELPGAIEEFLRLESPVQGLSRVLSRDTKLHGQSLRKGERVHMLFASANRDEAVFERAERLIPGRHPNPHLSFGLGIHFCLGASLARTELRVALAELLRRFPEHQPIWQRGVRQPSDTNRGFSALPVLFGGR